MDFLLSPTQVQFFLKHPYARGGTTLLDPIANPFYDWLSKFIPRSITPNTITFAGGACVVLMLYLVLFVRDRWVFAALTVLQFLATTLDGCDGKHARNTKQSSAVGAWVDHALDAFACPTFCVMNWAAVSGDEHSIIPMLGMASILLSWYSVHWEEACTQKEHFPFFADIEASTLNSVFLLQAFIFGPKNPELHYFITLIFYLGILVNLFFAGKAIWRVREKGRQIQWDMLLPVVIYSNLWVTLGLTEMWDQSLFAMKLILVFSFGLISARLILSNLAFDPQHPHTDFRRFATMFNYGLAGFQVLYAIDFYLLGAWSAEPLLLLTGIGLLLGYAHTFFSVYIQIQYYSKLMQ